MEQGVRKSGPHLHLVPDRGQLDAVPGRGRGHRAGERDGGVPGGVGHGVLRAADQPDVRQVLAGRAGRAGLLVADGLAGRRHHPCFIPEDDGLGHALHGRRRPLLLLRRRLFQGGRIRPYLACSLAHFCYFWQLIYICCHFL